MMLIKVYCFILLVNLASGQIKFSRSEDKGLLKFDCKTNDEGPQQLKPCKFPFIIAGRKFDGCTRQYDQNEILWCSTKVNVNQEHVSGHQYWGYCQPNCPTDLNGTLVSSTTTTTTTLELGREGDQSQTILENENPAIFLSTSMAPEVSEVTEGANFGIFDEELCGIDTSSGFIVGGRIAKRGSYPFMALLGYKNENGEISYECGGTLINRQYVVTAAHCQGKVQRDQIVEVVLGEHNLGKDPDCSGCRPVQRFSIQPEDVIVHENFVEAEVDSKANDIALIRLPRLAKTASDDTSEIVMPICFPRKSRDVFNASKFAVVGWGRTSENSGSELLQELNLTILGGKECKKKFPDYSRMTDEKQLCGGGVYGEDSCNGDSGGPLVAIHQNPVTKMYLAGIVSYGTGRCGVGLPGVYTNVLQYTSWIRQHIKP